MSPVNILLIDDHPMFRAGLNMVLQSCIPGAQVMEAGSLKEAMSTAKAPDVLLLDIQMEGVNGLAGIAPLKHKWPKTPIIILSSDASAETVRMAMERGASAFISKADRTETILATIEQALHAEPAAKTPIRGGLDQGLRAAADRTPVRGARSAVPGIVEPGDRTAAWTFREHRTRTRAILAAHVAIIEPFRGGL